MNSFGRILRADERGAFLLTEVLFYHLERARLEEVLPGLLEKTLARDWRAVVRTGSKDRAEALDAHLWTYKDEGFLPHAAAGEGARQPVWLTDGEDMPNAPQILFLVDGARADPAAIAALERCVMIFDGRDETAVGEARGFWKDVKAAGCDATYWKQSPQGGWEKQA
jgi:DNA polymerase III subunit chi